jgi:hypothetical protein
MHWKRSCKIEKMNTKDHMIFHKEGTRHLNQLYPSLKIWWSKQMIALGKSSKIIKKQKHYRFQSSQNLSQDKLFWKETLFYSQWVQLAHLYTLKTNKLQMKMHNKYCNKLSSVIMTCSTQIISIWDINIFWILSITINKLIHFHICKLANLIILDMVNQLAVPKKCMKYPVISIWMRFSSNKENKLWSN